MTTTLLIIAILCFNLPKIIVEHDEMELQMDGLSIPDAYSVVRFRRVLSFFHYYSLILIAIPAFLSFAWYWALLITYGINLGIEIVIGFIFCRIIPRGNERTMQAVRLILLGCLALVIFAIIMAVAMYSNPDDIF